jgi:hypothetical protein
MDTNEEQGKTVRDVHPFQFVLSCSCSFVALVAKLFPVCGDEMCCLDK